MTAPVDTSFYADPKALSSLKLDAKSQSPESLRAAARQFESLFTQMMLKSMRDATPKDSLFGSDQQDFYQDMFDSQMANQLSKGKGLGLADMLVRQLMQAGVAPEVAGKAAAAGAAQADATGGAAGTTVAVPTAASGKAFSPAGKQDFIDAIKPAAERAAAQLGVDTETLIAHAALETGWGRSLPQAADGGSSFNLFGIKAGASWQGDVATSRTQEFESGTRVARVADFRAYGSAEECMQDYARVIGQNPRYAAALNTGGDAEAFATALQRGGYATDPHYASKLTALAQQLKSHASAPIHDPDAA
jgi:flagellar protein FlgJ